MRTIFSKYLSLLVGNVGAQLIPLLITPFIINRYDLDQFGNYGIFIAIQTMMALVGMSKLDSALFLSENKFNAILNYTLLQTTLLSIVISPFILITKGIEMNLYLFFSSILMVYYRMSYSFFNKQEEIKFMSTTKFVRQTAIALLQILFSFSTNGLILGHLFGELLTFTYIIYLGVRPKLTTWNENITVFKNNLMFIKFSLPSDLINNLSNQLPIFYLDNFNQITLLGLYTVLSRYILAPMSLLSSIFSELFRSRIYADNNIINFKSDKKHFSLLIVVGSLLISFSIITKDFWISKYLNLNLNEFHTQAFMLMIIFGVIKLVVSPFTHYYYILKKNNLDLIWQCIYLLMIMIGLFLLYFDFGNLFLNIFIFGSISYVINLIFIYHFSYDFNNKP